MRCNECKEVSELVFSDEEGIMLCFECWEAKSSVFSDRTLVINQTESS